MGVHLVETSEDDSFQSVATFIASLQGSEQAADAFLSEYATLVEADKLEELVGKLAAQLPTVFSKGSEADADCVLAMLVHLVQRMPGDEAAARAARKLASAIAQQPDVGGLHKLAALSNLFSAAGSPAAQYHVLLTTLAFAASDRALAVSLAPSVRGKAEGWQRSWKLPDSMARDLLLAIAHLLKVAGDKSSIKEYLKLTTAALGLPADAKDAAALKAVAAAVVADFIRSTDVYQCDFADAPAVAALASDAQHGPLVALLRAMLAGDLAGFRKAATPAALQAAGVSQEAALEKMRLMALLVLGGACADSHRAATFAEIQAALEVPEQEVQAWVVKAIGRKLMDGKIDQVAGCVAITRCHHRAFTASEWARLDAQLAAWQESLGAVAANLASGQAGGAVPQAAARLSAVRA